MNIADQIIAQQILAKPWRDLSLCGVSCFEDHLRWPSGRVDRELVIQLAWMEKGVVHDEYAMTISASTGVAELRDLLKEAAAFSRGSIPVAWGAQARALLTETMSKNPEALDGVDLKLCFLLRKKSRWLDPSIWCRIRTGKLLPMDTIMESVRLAPIRPAIDVAALAYHLPTRDGFPVKPEWTASETAEWQELQEAF